MGENGKPSWEHFRRVKDERPRAAWWELCLIVLFFGGLSAGGGAALVTYALARGVARRGKDISDGTLHDYQLTAALIFGVLGAITAIRYIVEERKGKEGPVEFNDREPRNRE